MTSGTEFTDQYVVELVANTLGSSLNLLLNEQRISDRLVSVTNAAVKTIDAETFGCISRAIDDVICIGNM